MTFSDIDPKELRRLRKRMDDFIDQVIPRKTEVGEWEEWFAWHPVKLHGKRVWLKKVYRRCINTYFDHDDWKRYDYGTLLDVLK